ncbi:arginase [Nonlabens sp. YIK11]|uniref:formimidoylglutamase n=1 Tax=Nonlabens sp. YIK11 TaxID=1453349 RepID=UPI0006DC0374|nr:formimidoylglutamase [Nonlabens sp. YIK11]KQC32785.1 arginase [Nonlabens sp. YIK11]
MSLEYLQPIDDATVAHARIQEERTLGKTILLHTKQDGLPDLGKVDIVLISVLENRRDQNALLPMGNLDGVRRKLYELFPGNWHSTIADLGDIQAGESVEDTYYVVRELTAYFLKEEILPIILGGSQDLMYPMYRAFDDIKAMINVVNVDHRFDLGNIEMPIDSHSYIGKMVATEPYNLFNYSNLGYQTYFNSQEEIDLLDRLFFDAIRLGELQGDMTIAEPVIRDCDLLGIDLLSVQANDLLYDKGHPNGFQSAQMCSLSRYSGISDRLKAFGIFEIPSGDFPVLESAVSQIIWYFLEGYNFRHGEYPINVSSGFLKYQVPIEDQVLNFYKSVKTERWWIELPFNSAINNKLKQYTLLPCDKKDYLQATDQILPERWLKARQKNEI